MTGGGCWPRYSSRMTEQPQPYQLTARIAAHPSDMIPGIPRFVFSVPAGWVIDEAPSALCVVRTPKEIDGFWPNAIIRHDSAPRSLDFEKAAQLTWAKLKRDTPDATDHGERLMRFGSRVVYTRGVELPGPDGRRLAQLQSLFFAPVDDAGKTVPFFQIIGTTTVGPRTDDDMKSFVEILASFRFV